VLEAFQDAGMTAADVGAVFVGKVMVRSSHLPATCSQLSCWIGTQGRRPTPASRVPGAGAYAEADGWPREAGA
jgi:hypothetical protein